MILDCPIILDDAAASGRLVVKECQGGSKEEEEEGESREHKYLGLAHSVDTDLAVHTSTSPENNLQA